MPYTHKRIGHRNGDAGISLESGARGNGVSAKYDHLSREDLIALLKKRDADHNLGLVWDGKDRTYRRAVTGRTAVI